VGADLFHADRQSDRRTDMMKLTVAFRNFANAANNRSADQGSRRLLQFVFTSNSSIQL